MRNLRLTIEYDGTDYAGWQVQRKTEDAKRNPKTLQETIEQAIQKILQEKIHLIASGRTDRGVHAKAQVANFRTNSTLGTDKLRRGVNALLPDDIVVASLEEAASGFHSRFAAKSKTYRYTILNRDCRSALLRKRVYFYPYPLDIELMRNESRILLGRHNFKAFQSADKKERNPLRTIKKIKISRERDLIYIDIEADGFLYNMVRNIVGTLLEIGRGKFPRGSLKKILLSKDRTLAGPTASAHGLCLMRVNY